MSSEDTVSDPLVNWSTSGLESEVDWEVDSGEINVMEHVSVADSLSVPLVNIKDLLERGIVRALA